MKLNFLRIPRASNRALISDPSYYRLASDFLMPPPVKIGKWRSGVIEYELDEVLCARAAGASDSEIRELIKALIAKRNNLLKTGATTDSAGDGGTAL